MRRVRGKRKGEKGRKEEKKKRERGGRGGDSPPNANSWLRSWLLSSLTRLQSLCCTKPLLDGRNAAVPLPVFLILL